MTRSKPRIAVVLAALAALSALFAAAARAQDEAPRSPGARDAARRLLVLKAVHAVRFYPRAGEAAPAELVADFERERKATLAWLRREKLIEHATEWERTVLESEVGTLPSGAAARAGEQREAMVALLWALGLIDEMPPYDGSVTEVKLKRRVPKLGDPTAEFIEGARLRAREELDTARETSTLWHWRAHTRQLIDAGEFPRGAELAASRDDVRRGMQRLGLEAKEMSDGRALFEELIRFSAEWARRKGIIAAPVDSDFPSLGKAYRELDAREFQRARALARERHRALSWLGGEAGASWDSVSTDI